METSKLKPFDLEKALAGAKVVTRDGLDIVRVIHIPEVEGLSLVAVHERGGATFHDANTGETSVVHGTAGYDLFLAPTTRTAWVNLYPNHSLGYFWFGSEEVADAHEGSGRINGKAFKLEWEE